MELHLIRRPLALAWRASPSTVCGHVYSVHTAPCAPGEFPVTVGGIGVSVS